MRTGKTAVVFTAFFLIFHSGYVSGQQKAAPQKPVLINIEGSSHEVYKQSYALLIGEGSYTSDWGPLNSSARQTKELEKVLKDMGFATTLLIDADKTSIDKAISTFINNYGLKLDNRLLFYFAGHGYSIKSSIGISIGSFVPVDAPRPEKNSREFHEKVIESGMFELYSRQIKSKHTLFIFDACFSGSFMAASTPEPESISEKLLKPSRQFIIAGGKAEIESSPSTFTRLLILGLKGDADMNSDNYITASELAKYIATSSTEKTPGNSSIQYGRIRNSKFIQGDFIQADFIQGDFIFEKLQQINQGNTPRQDDIKPRKKVEDSTIKG